MPEVALFDLERLQKVPLSDTITIEDLTDEACEFEDISNRIIDAACSVEDGYPGLLIVKPKTLDELEFLACPNWGLDDCRDYMNANPPLGTPTPLEFVVMPDPIDAPNQPLVSMNSFSTAVSSVDALDWRGDYANGDYSVRVLATHHELQFYQPPGIVGQPLPDPYLVPKTYVKRMNWDYNATATEPVYSHQNFGTHTHDKVAEFSGPLRVRGLSYFGSCGRVSNL